MAKYIFRAFNRLIETAKIYVLFIRFFIPFLFSLFPFPSLPFHSFSAFVCLPLFFSFLFLPLSSLFSLSIPSALSLLLTLHLSTRFLLSFPSHSQSFYSCCLFCPSFWMRRRISIRGCVGPSVGP